MTMRKELLLFFTTILLFNVSGQDNLDSMYLQAVNSDKKGKIESLIALAEIYKDENLDSCISVLKQAYDLSSQTDEDQHLPDIYQLMGVYYSQVGNYIFALKYSNYALTKKKTLDYPIEEIAEIQNNIGSIYLKQNNFKEAIDYYNLALKNWKTFESVRTGSAYVNLGAAYYYMGEKEKALEYYQKGEQFFSELNDSKELANIYNHLGRLHQEEGDFEKAKIYFERALNTFIELDYHSGIADGYNNLAILYYYQEKVQLALAYFKKALNLRKEEGELLPIGESYYNLGSLYQFEGMHKEAVLHFKKALEYSQLGDSPSEIEDASFAVSENFKLLKKYDSAYKYLSICINYKDTVATKKFDYLKNELKYNESKTESQLLASKSKYDNKIKEKRTGFEKKMQSKNEKIILLYFVVSSLIAALLFVLYLYLKQRKLKNVSEQSFSSISDTEKNQDLSQSALLTRDIIGMSNSKFKNQQSIFNQLSLSPDLSNTEINFYEQNGLHFFTPSKINPLNFHINAWIYDRLTQIDFDLKNLNTIEKNLKSKLSSSFELFYFSIRKYNGNFQLTGKFVTVLMIKDTEIISRLDFNHSITEEVMKDFDYIIVITYKKDTSNTNVSETDIEQSIREGSIVLDSSPKDDVLHIESDNKIKQMLKGKTYFIAKI